MNVTQYGQWAPTQKALHMVMQMMGKIKLAKMPPQPEWGHVLLYPTAQGFTTGLVPCAERSFDLSVNVQTSMVYAHSTSGDVAGFPLRNNTSVAEYWSDFQRMMKNTEIEANCNPHPQEVPEKRPFSDQTEKFDYDESAAEDFFQTAVFAHSALLDFCSAFRGKKLLPAMFWGTFDLSCVLFSGQHAPFPGAGLIEKMAFDEKMVEFGFWPGDANTPDPSFFVLPYPFLDSLPSEVVSPCQAYFSPEKKEYFLPLKDALGYADPHGVVVEFCRDAFTAVCQKAGWQGTDWLTKPL